MPNPTAHSVTHRTAADGPVPEGGHIVAASIKEAGTAIGYVRVSTEEQALEGVSLDAQRAKIDQYCDLHGLTLAHVYADEGLSGKRADNRPGLQEAVCAACRAKAALVVYSLSRLARSTRDAIDIAERMNKCGADLISITEKIDTTTGMGRFFFTTIAALAQLERDQISERTAAALAHMKANGRRVGGIPYGYTVSSDGETLVECCHEQKTVALIRRLREQGASLREVVAELDRRGIPP